jgi:DNA repair protein RadD
MQLRPYQQEAIAAAYAAIKASKEPALVVLPTGAGKSAVIASMALDCATKWKGRCLILSHVRELIGQVAETIRAIDILAPVGVYSAGLNRRDTEQPIICAGVQSVYSKACELGRFNLVLIDECHLIPTDGEGMYRTLINALLIINPDLRIVGLTATDFRLDSGYIHGAGKLFPSVCYDAKVRSLIDQGYLSDLRGKDGGKPDLSAVHLRGGEYIPGELEAAMTDDSRVRMAVAEIVKHGQGRKAWLVFCCGVAHAKMVSEALGAQGIEAPIVVAETPSSERKELIDRYKAKGLRCLVSVGVLTTGFDAPHVDLVVLLRPTKSPGLMYQMIGRGLRKSEGKSDCMILDLAGAISEHGPVDDLRIKEKKEKGDGDAPTKSCPTCQEILHASVRQCPACGYEFPREIAKHDQAAHDVTPLVQHVEEWLPVHSWEWQVHNKKAGGKIVEGATQTLRVIYHHSADYMDKPTSEWVCLGHSGFARSKAVAWWEQNAEGNAPDSALAGLDELDKQQCAGTLRKPSRLLVRTSGQFPEILKREFSEDKAEPQPAPVAVYDDDECPF